MNPALDALLRTLDAAPAPVSVFIRDDDGGWNDNRLFALLDLTVRHGVPLDLAVIPQAMDTVLARELRNRHDTAQGLLGLHQHGFAHMNHEPDGQACEFGRHRPLMRQRSDLRLGRERLRGHLGQRLDAIFSPPWGGCSEPTIDLLCELGFLALSRNRAAAVPSRLPELPVDVDWCALERAARDHAAPGEDASAAAASAILLAMAQRVQAGGPIGLLLGHAQMDGASLRLLDGFLTALGRHPRLHWRTMRELLGLPDRRPARIATRLAA